MKTLICLLLGGSPFLTACSLCPATKRVASGHEITVHTAWDESYDLTIRNADDVAALRRYFYHLWDHSKVDTWRPPADERQKDGVIILAQYHALLYSFTIADEYFSIIEHGGGYALSREFFSEDREISERDYHNFLGLMFEMAGHSCNTKTTLPE